MFQPTAPKLTLRLKPFSTGALTQLALSGPIYTLPPATELRSLFCLLEEWHGRSVDVALSVVGTSEGARWTDLWADRLAMLPARLHRVRFVVNRATLTRDPDGEGGVR